MSNAEPGKKAKREHAREVARQMREAERKRRVRNRIFLQGGIGVVILAIIAVVVVVVVSSNSATTASAVGPANMASDGILLTGNGSSISAVQTPGIPKGGTPTATDESAHAKTVNVVTYIDYQCPYCDQFETANEASLQQLLTAGTITLEIHPIAFLDSSSLGNKYSTRADNAAACVAQYDPDSYLAFNTAMFANQPAEQTNGRTDNQIKKVVSDAGITDSKVADCISAKTFVPWTAAATDRVMLTRSSANGGDGTSFLPNSDKVNFAGTPTVLIDGAKYNGQPNDAAAFMQQLNAAIAAKSSASTPTPAATE